MGTENFTKIKPVLASNEGTELAAGRNATLVSSVGLVNNPGLRPGIEPAGLFSTAPYVDPSIARKAKLRAQEEQRQAEIATKHCKAKGGTCKGWAGEDGLCRGHRQSLAKGKDIGI